MRASLEIIETGSGKTRVVLQSDRHIEAPNWTPDGTALLVNAEGRLYRVDLGDPALVPVDTGRHGRLNNDHGISPDGRLLAFCDKTETAASCIYTMPVAGGVPRRVTPRCPSWFHGFSPEGTRLAYACVRDGQFGIASCALDGSDETLLVTSAHHYDGPDYTPCGEWIWFNSDREGAMSLWRIRVDGSGLERMSFGGSVDWFAHPSPDGEQVCYLAYAPGTEGHPAGCDVELRLMPATGGAPETLLAFHGGQGSLNVPSWAPGGGRFAFVRYAASA
ncbi:hypothetical protein [Marinovum sp.]|uniref:TolB family protein n=1 Tax=Marinovum sp. TaxID=2024839 RepID=UPI002B27B4AB|nr:hypothetical protein [Marinovum sp.]